MRCYYMIFNGDLYFYKIFRCYVTDKDNYENKDKYYGLSEERLEKDGPMIRAYYFISDDWKTND